MPESIARIFAVHGYEKDQVLAYAVSDLSSSGDFSESHVVLVDDKILVIENGKLAKDIFISEIENIEQQELFASSCLKAIVDKKEIDIVYYTSAKTEIFTNFYSFLNKYITDKQPGVVIDEQNLSCDKCGYPLPESGSACPKCVPKWYVLKRLMSLLLPYRSKLFIVVACTFIAVAAQMAPPYITKRLVDDVILIKDTNMLATWVGLMLLAGLIYLLCRWAITAISSWLSARLITDLRSRLHKHLQHLQIAYYNKRSSGDIVARVMQDTTELQQFLIEGLPFILVNSLSFIAIAIILVSLDPTLAMIAFLPVPFLVLGVHWIWKYLRPLLFKRARYRGEITSILGESIRGVRAVKTSGCESAREKIFNDYNEKFFDSLRRVMTAFSGFAEGSFWLMSVGVAVIWFAASVRLTEVNTTLTLGDLLAFVGYIWLFYAPLQWFGVVMNWMNNAFAGAERIFNILDTAPEIYESADCIKKPNIKGNICFENVHFSYEKGKEVLKGVNLEIKQGEMIGLVGKSGMGKSTLINMICRFYEPEAGSIKLDDKPLDLYRLEDLRQSIGVVMQDPFIFYGSIRDNISIGRPNATFNEIVEAAKAANSHEFILGKEFGYDTVIGENGIQLSGGERQRITIARAILQDPAILILDEATSLVDSETEQIIQQAIDRLIQGRTTIAIAHRLATLKNADRLLVIDNGEILEHGTHKELLHINGVYARLVKVQSELNRLQAKAHIA